VPYGEWRFDYDSQSIFLDNPLSGENVAVTVSFAPGKPFTTAYLEAQPLLDSITLLNEGTPPVPKHQDSDSTPTATSGSRFNDPNDTFNEDADFIYNDPYSYLSDEKDPDSLYSRLEFIEVDNGGEEGLLSSICDGGAPAEIGFSGGLVFQDTLKTPLGDYSGITGTGFTTTIGTGSAPSPVSPNPFGMGSTSVLYASGGNFVDGTVGPGTSLVIQNYPSVGRPGEGLGAINKGMTYRMNLTTVLTSVRRASTPVDEFGNPILDEFGNPVLVPDPDSSHIVLVTEVPLEDSFDSVVLGAPEELLDEFGDPILDEFGDPILAAEAAYAFEWLDDVSATLETPADYSRAGPWAGYDALSTESFVGGTGASLVLTEIGDEFSNQVVDEFGNPIGGFAPAGTGVGMFVAAGGSSLPGSTTVDLSL
jgi:hypothetical protein